MVQKHLTYEEMTNLGCFYTPEKFVDELVKIIHLNVPNYNKFVFADTSCGYGAFLSKFPNCLTIGCDIDEKALQIAHDLNPDSIYYNKNTLYEFDLENIGLSKASNLIIIGNPPYNDTTSKVKNKIKNAEPCLVDEDLKTRDLGISFMLSYDKLKAKYVAILHPLSYMIKKANYKLLQPFYENYNLIDHIIVNSQEFGLTSKSSGFPIIVALYKRDQKGMSYQEIINKTYKTIEGNIFNVNVESIGKYLSKYPSKFKKHSQSDILFFTMRDINALKRSKTFITEYGDNAIIIDKDKFPLYCYVDVFKDYIGKMPYYLGNCDVFINYELFKKNENAFISKSIIKHPYLQNLIHFKSIENNPDIAINDYFKFLLGGKDVY